MKLCKLLGTFLLCLSLSACSMIPVDQLIDRPLPTTAPTLPTAQPGQDVPYSPIDYTTEVQSERGTELILNDPTLGHLLLEASQNPSLRVDNASCAFTHEVFVYNEAGGKVLEVKLARDGCLHAQNPDGSVFRVPPYVWYTVETALWSELDALWNEPFLWKAEGESRAALEIRLPYLLNSILCAQLGYADGYFSSYEIYEVKVLDHQVQLYLLAVQQGCSVQGEALRTVWEQGMPMRLTFDELEDDHWRLSACKLADFSDGVKKEAVRSVFSYENTALAMEDLSDLSPWLEPMKMQIRSFMLNYGLSHLQWES